MFDNDLLLAFAFMSLLFLRQVSILKQPNKINYAPLMIGIGTISSVIHFIIHPDATNIILLLRESFFPLLVALFFYIVMNILHQTQQRENALLQDEFTKALISQVTQLKEFASEIEARMVKNQQEDRQAQEDVREKFKKDIQTLDTIEVNQGRFMDKFDEMQQWHESVSKEFEQFRAVEMPELDNVVHKHIDMLRVAEQEHYNKLKNILQKAVQNRSDISEDIDELKIKLSGMKEISDDIARSITKHTLEQLSGVTTAFQKQIISLKTHSESVRTSLYEGENILGGIREQSEMIMKQMILSSNKMEELESKNSGLHDIYSTLNTLVKDIEHIKADYVKSQSQLSMLTQDIKISESEQIDAMKVQIESLGNILTQKIDDSLEKLHEHYHIAGEDITQSVQMLAKKAQLQKGYTELDS